MNVNDNRKLMAIEVKGLAARANPEGVERYIAGLSAERPRVHEMQSRDKVRNRPKRYNPKIGVIDMEKGTARFNYGRYPNFEDMDKKDEIIEEWGYEITSINYELDRERGITYVINFEPRDLVA